MAQFNKYSDLSDQELLVRIKDNTDYLGIVYNRCKRNCINFMRKMTSGKISDYELEDIFQDATIVLYEKIINRDFVLTASFQTYLNSVCRFQLLNTIGKSKLTTEFQDDSYDDNDDSSMGYLSSITDTLDEIEHSNEPLFLAIERALELMKTAGGKCYELLTQFWYKKRSMKELTEIFEYTNPANTKSQKAKCQERLRVMSHNELKQI
ncbi:MAG TPA: sigma-70 family RNA polymerase sigma factor [Flavobacterium sp.]|nr:sigma-70 family RNA polymerase sigma factor [Flavobacterium sp.]